MLIPLLRLDSVSSLPLQRSLVPALSSKRCPFVPLRSTHSVAFLRRPLVGKPTPLLHPIEMNLVMRVKI